VLMMAPLVVANMERPLEFSRRLDIVVHLDSLIERPGILSTLTTDPDYNSIRYPPLYSFARFFRRCSRLKTAKSLLQGLLAARQTAGISAEDPTSIDIQIELGYTLRDNAEFKAGMECLKTVKGAFQELNTMAYCRCLIGFADTLCAQYLLSDARAIAQEALDLADKLEDQWRLRADIRLVMARVEGQRGSLKESGRLINEACNMAKEHLGPEDDLTLEAEAMLALNMSARGEPWRAKDQMEAVLPKMERRNGIDHRNTLNAILLKGMIYGSAGLHNRARELFELSKSRARLQFENTPGEISIEIAIGNTFAGEGNFSKAKDQYELAKSMAEKTKDQLNLRRATASLFILYIQHGYFIKALPMMKIFIETFPFAYSIRTNKITWVPGMVLILLFILSWFQPRFAITAGFSVAAIAVAILI
jgi:tetratricopeptide (TPR) repeat protein